MGQNSSRDNQPGSPVGTMDSVRLDSWKEIASYLHRDARTVRRWERERRLPVHRVPGGERSGVFAYVDELDRWLRASDADTVADDDAPEADDSPIFGSSADAQGPRPAFAEAGDRTPSSQLSDPSSPLLLGEPKDPASSLIQAAISVERQSQNLHLGSSRWAFYGMASLLVVALAAGSGFAFVRYRRLHQPSIVVSRSSAEAQDLYLRGRYFWNLRTENGLNQAVDLFTQSIVNDPQYAPAYAGLADSYLLLRQYGHMPDAEAYPRALAAARQAVALDPLSPDAHRSIAFVLCFWNWNMQAAEKEYLRAIELDPKNSQSHHWYATALFSAGRLKEALEQIDLARALEPQSVSVLADRGLILSSEDPERGVEALRQLVQTQPAFVSAHSYLSRAYLNLGDYPRFLTEARAAAVLLNETDQVAILDQARKDLETRGPAFMLGKLAAGMAALADGGHTSAYAVARLFGIAGDSAQALHYLQVACDRRDPGFLSFESDEAFRHVRTTPEYLALLARKDALPVAHLDRPGHL